MPKTCMAHIGAVASFVFSDLGFNKNKQGIFCDGFWRVTCGFRSFGMWLKLHDCVVIH